MNRRKKTIFLICISIIVIFSIFIGGLIIPETALKADFSIKNSSPSLNHIFGTDYMGRDMFLRTIKGMSTSIIIGMVSSFISVVIAVVLGTVAGTFSKYVDGFVCWLIDFFMGIPHIILLILISFALGRGFKGIFIGIAVTHWTSLARIIRGEVIQIKNEQYIKISKKMGKSNFYIMKNHILPFVIPQTIIGGILLFPHAILHEASVTFLGFGLSPETPAIGIILSESMKYITTGYWWLAFFPGLVLIVVVVLFDILGESIKLLINPYTSQE